MTEVVTLFGFQHSVYTWVARMTLQTTGVTWRDVEVNPFAPETGTSIRPHPFGRVPVLEHDDFRLYETQAITSYIDARFGQRSLTPSAPHVQARMRQVIGVVDAYAYVPMVRHVFAHSVFRPWAKETSDPNKIVTGLGAAEPVLTAMEDIAAEGLVLTGNPLTLADCHLAPMMAYFTAAPAGFNVLDSRPALARWWDKIRRENALVATWPAGPVQKP